MFDSENSDASDIDSDLNVRPVEVQDTLREATDKLTNAMNIMYEESSTDTNILKTNVYKNVETARQYVRECLAMAHHEELNSEVQTAYNFLQKSHDDVQFMFPNAYGEFRQAMDKLEAVLATV